MCAESKRVLQLLPKCHNHFLRHCYFFAKMQIIFWKIFNIHGLIKLRAIQNDLINPHSAVFHFTASLKLNEICPPRPLAKMCYRSWRTEFGNLWMACQKSGRPVSIRQVRKIWDRALKWKQWSTRNYWMDFEVRVTGLQSFFQRGYLMNDQRTKTKWDSTVNRKFFLQFPWPIQAWLLSFTTTKKLSISALPKTEKLMRKPFVNFVPTKLIHFERIAPSDRMREKKKALLVFF